MAVIDARANPIPPESGNALLGLIPALVNGANSVTAAAGRETASLT